MPNPTPNQPLDQHPLAALMKSEVLGKDALFFKAGDIEDSVDKLIVPGPPTGVVRKIGGALSLNSGVFYSPGELDPGVAFVLKKKAGGESIVEPIVAVGVGEVFGPMVSTFLSLFLTDEDEGYYLRAAAAGAEVASVTGHTFWSDTRNIEVVNTPLPDVAATRIAVLSNPATAKSVIQLAAYEQPAPSGGILCHNLDSVLHTITVFLSDGTTDIPLETASGVGISAGTSGPLASLPAVLLPGWSIKVESDAPVTTLAPIVSARLFNTNYGPVRQDQGGAY